MDDDDWGMDNAEETKAVKEQEKFEKQQEKEEEEEQNKGQDESSWVREKPKEQPSTKEGSGRNGGRTELKQAVVEENAVELKPDKEQESFWGEDDKKQKEKSVEKPSRLTEERGRGRGNRDGQEQGQRGGGRTYERNYRNNDQGEGDRRGNQDGNNEWRGNRGGFNNDRGGRNYDRGQRGGQRPERGGERGGDRGGERGERGQYRGRGRGGYNGGGYNGGGYNRNFQNNQEQTVPQTVQQKKPEVAVPKARKCWPECNIYIFGIKLCITFKRIQDFKCKLLVVPFKTPKLQFYPGNLVNQSQVNYKEKIVKKELKVGGETYFQKAQKIADFEAVAFLKIDDFDIEESLNKGIKQVFQQVEGINQANLQSVVFSFCDELGDPRHAIQQVIKGLQEATKIKSFYINTISQGCFLQCVRGFMQEMKFLFEENEVSIE